MNKKIIILICAISIALSAGAQWTIDSVNTVGLYPYSGATSNKAVFTNGGEWNVFDANSNTHTFGSLSLYRSMIDVVSYGEKVYFGGGKFGYWADPQYTNLVDVYDGTTNTWSTLTLSKKREVGGAGAAGNKIVFAGGRGSQFVGNPSSIYATADIFDVTTGARTIGKLSKARSNIAVGASGNKIVFAGGWFWDFNYNIINSDVADIYDVSTGTWTKATISVKRENMAVAVVGSKIIFAGGTGGPTGIASNVDIYDVSTDTWTIGNLPTPRYSMQTAVIGTNAYFAGGASYSAVENEVDIFNTVANSWSTIYLPVSLSGFSMSVINDKIYFAGGYIASSSSYSSLVQIYDPATSIWSTEYLSEGRNSIDALTVTNKGYFAGGVKAYGYPVPVYTKRVDILSTSSPIANFTSNVTVLDAGGTVDFTDQSINTPTAWSWTFAGGTPATSTVQNPTGIQYNTPGTYDVTLTATNAQGSSTITKTGFVTVNVPPCLVPDGLNTTAITFFSATLNWNTVSGATKYKVSWKVSGNNPWTTTTITGASKTVTGLLPNTAYTWKVKSVCDGGVSSAFSPTSSFTTNSVRISASVASGITAYPNPATDQLLLSASEAMQLPLTCTIYDIYGNAVREFVLNNYQQAVNVSNWPTGNYFVRVVDVTGISVSLKFSKQ